jgi:hypothetical protein
VTGSRALIAVPVLVAAAIGLAGCQEAERAAPAQGSSGGSSPHASGPAATSDPLAGVEATVDTVERDVDSDADADAGTGR